MIDIVETLVFALVMTMFMAFPAIKIVEFVEKKKALTQKNKNFLIILFTLLISLGVGVFLKYF